MDTNRLRPADQVKIEVYNNAGKEIAFYLGSGFRDISDAINTAYDNAMAREGDIEDFVFVVTDETEGTTGRYRINAGGHVRSII